MDDRYNRQQLIPDWNQDALKNSTVLVLGVGATGSYLATNVILAGVGKLILVDFDTIELSNLNRQLLFTEADIGKNKAMVAKEKLQVLNPDSTIISFPQAMEKLPKELLKGINVIACCLDTFKGRRWANSLAIREGVPIINGGMYGFLGDVQTIIPNVTPCFECQPLISQEKLSQACSPLGEARIGMEKPEAPLPSVSTLSSIIAGLMSQEILKILMDIGKPIENFMFYDGLNQEFTKLQLKRNENCPICGSKFELEEREALVFENEDVKDLRMRIALAFGLAQPMLIVKGKILVDEQRVELENGTKIFVSDERLAKPISVKVKVE